MPAVFTPYSTGAGMFGAKPGWLSDELDIERIQAYQLYEEIYWNVPDVLKVTQRGTNNMPLYVPAAKTIVDSTSRYTAPGFAVGVLGPNGTTSTDSTEAMTNLQAFLRRERFKSKFNGNKRYGLIRGDALWHITADPEKPEGSRISITAIDPGMYFPITDDNDVDSIIGVHLAEYIAVPEPMIHRITYRKTDDGGISVEDGWFEVDGWGGPSAKRIIGTVDEITMLPPQITSLPVYHIKNTEEPGNPFGSSELRGLERLFAGLHQTMSDEDLALALEGIGIYATNSNPPTNAKGEIQPWRIGPGRVLHYDGDTFQRVSGVDHLGENYGAHYDRIWQAIKQAAATPDVALGTVDVTVAQSGVALALQLGPMLAKAGEKNDIITDVHNQMFYDWLNMWEPAYEQNTYEGVTISCALGDAVPVDRAARFAELNDMLDRGVIDTAYYRTEATKLGYVFPDTIGETAKAEFDDRHAQADPFAQRLNIETGDGAPVAG